MGLKDCLLPRGRGFGRAVLDRQIIVEMYQEGEGVQR
jgi:hypothetical protein